MGALDPEAILGPKGAIARRLPGYESRPEQLQMAGAIARTIEEGGHLIVEAGTGVGKSFAYLVPAIQSAVELQKRVVVSTHTINLQEQLLHKDLPFLRSVLPYEFSAALVKGRGNYVSLRRLRATMTRSGAMFDRADDLQQLNRLRAWADRTDDGSRSDLDFRPSAAVWEAIESDSGNCLGRRCSTFRDCHFFKAVRRAANANILVVNHALYMTDLGLRAIGGGGILPEHELVIFDEAHRLEEVAAAHLGPKVTSGAIASLLNRLLQDRTARGLLVFHRLTDAQARVREARIASEAFFDSVESWVQRQPTPNGRAYQPTGLSDELAEALLKLATAVRRGAEAIDDEEQQIELTAAADRAEAYAGALRDWLSQRLPDSVYWVQLERGSWRRVTLASAPLDLGPALARDLFDRVPTCILTSATLATGSPPSFTFFRSRIGLRTARTLRLGSPFDYARQATLHLVRNLPDPATDPRGFERASLHALKHYLALTHGKALVLFTSHRHLAEAARELGSWLADRGIALLAQSDGMPRSRMIAAFREDVDSVIFGAESFWQGVDLPGETLSNVIMVRLPFRPPDDPLTEARLEDIRRRGGQPFFDYQVPEAILKLKQGFGRLIRGKTDSGIVVILDPRVLTKPYGRQFLDSLPPCRRVIDDHGSVAD